MKLTFAVSTAAALCLASSATALTPLFHQVAEAQKKAASDCTRHGQCYDMRLQNVQGCTDGWTLHGLWPQWGESCTQEKFDYSEIQDLADDLKEYWPSCQGSAQDFWEHEWSKHGTCSGMSQHDFFSTAINLCMKYRGQCSNSNDGNCNICLDKNLDSTETCDSSNGKKYANINAPSNSIGSKAKSTATVPVHREERNKIISSSDCTRHGQCYDMRLQNVQGCTDGWTLHGLWPQWAESCSHEKFDYRQIQDLADELKEYWPSCQGSAQDFWEHEWSKHGTCSGMSQHDFFSTAINLCMKYRGQCSNSNDGNCNICLDKNLDSTETCDSSNGKKYANIKTRFHRHH